MVKTKKLYYEDSFLSSCHATVIDIKENKIILDQTVAFPEGGGQIGDKGKLLVNGVEIPFVDTKKGVGRALSLNDFPSVHVDTQVYHFIDESYLPSVSIGDSVIVQIDIQHRIWTTVLHSALHLVLMAARERRPEITNIIKGCKITTESARIDFFAKEKFLPEDIEWISHRINGLVTEELPIYVYHHNEEDEAWYWKCLEFICPCGGMHLINTRQAGKLAVRRKNVGKTTERLIVTARDIELNETDYRDEI